MSVLFGPAKGVQLRLDPNHHAPLMLGYYELELVSSLKRFAAHADCVFDVGGAFGYDALMLAQIAPGRVVTFEPLPDKVMQMQHNLELNRSLADRVVVRAEPLGAPGDGVATVDEMAAIYGAPKFIKIDVDGGEVDVLRGAERTLLDHRPHLVIETHSPELERQSGDLLLAAGYRPRIKHNRKVLVEHRPSPHCRWLIAEGRS